MKMVGGHDLHRVDALFLFEHLAEIGIGGAALVLAGGLLRSVICFHHALAGIASAGNGALDSRAPIGLLEDAAEVGEQSVAVPIAVIYGVLVGVADGGDADVLRGQEVGHLADSLRARTDIGEIDLIAWGDVPGSSEHASGDDGEGSSGGGAAQKLAAVGIGHHGR